MRKLVVALVVACTGLSAIAQGTINFNNRLSSTIWAKVTDPGGAGLAGAGYSAQLFAGPLGSAENALTPVAASLTTFRTGAAAGAWLVPSPDPSIGGVINGAQAVLQVRAWANNGGTLASYDAAVAAGAQVGKSALFTSLPLGGGNPPTAAPNIVGNADPLNNMQGFALVPEPSVLALGVLGVAGLLLRRRKA